jgi:hypothetical protein
MTQADIDNDQTIDQRWLNPQSSRKQTVIPLAMIVCGIIVNLAYHGLLDWRSSFRYGSLGQRPIRYN